MIDHIFTILCNNSVIDSESNTISIHEVLEQITVFTDSEEAFRLPIHFEILSNWTRSHEDIPAKGKTRLLFFNPNNECQQQGEFIIDLSKVIYYRTRIKSGGIELKGPGKYKFVVELQQEDSTNWEKVASMPLLVGFKQPEPKE